MTLRPCITLMACTMVITLALFTAPPGNAGELSNCPSLTACFTPGGNCTDAIVKALREAKSSVFVQAYSFTSAPIAKALVEAQKRGVKADMILDKSNRTAKYSAADFTANSGIPTKIDAQHEISHNKVMIVDGEIVITGSFNFTKGAQEKNAENFLIIRDKGLAATYIENWQAHAQHSEPNVGRGARQAREQLQRGVLGTDTPEVQGAQL
jgi:phosphatidylserine/phosphatidylglycerophosphate/cardiolipin synthase-like enzyme